MKRRRRRCVSADITATSDQTCGRRGHAAPPRRAAVPGHRADGRRGARGPRLRPRAPVRPAVRPRHVPGHGGRGPAGQRHLHGDEEPAGGGARTLPPAPAHGHALQPAAGPGDTEEVGPNSPRDVGGLRQPGPGARAPPPPVHPAALDHGAAAVLRHRDEEPGARRAALTARSSHQCLSLSFFCFGLSAGLLTTP